MRYLRFVVLVIPLVIGLRLAPSSAVAAGNTLTVCANGCDSTTIGGAVSLANPGDTISVSPGTYVENLIVGEALTINGAGADSTFIDGGGAGRVLTINGADVSVSNLTIRNGLARGEDGTRGTDGALPNHGTTGGGGGAGDGGGIFLNGGSLMLSNSTVSGNQAVGGGGGAGGNTTSYCRYDAGAAGATGGGGGAGFGGGVYVAAGQLTVTDSTFTGNSATGGGGGSGGNGRDCSGYGGDGGSGGAASGGGIYAGGGTVTVSGSTFDGNTVQAGAGGGGGSGDYWGGGGGGGGSGFGGGLFNGGSTMSITDSTLTGNQALGGAGGRNNPTYFGGHPPGAPGAGTGGGISDIDGPVSLVFDTIAGNTGGGGVDDEDGVTVLDTLISGNSGGNCTSRLSLDLGFNLEDDRGASCGFSPNNHDIVGQNPMLGNLADNGGPTETMALARSSPALDHGTCGVIGLLLPAVDQRGSSRLSGKGCDIGAFETLIPFTLTISLVLPPGAHMPASISFTNNQMPLGTATPTTPLKVQFQQPTFVHPGPSGSALYLATRANPITVFAVGFVPLLNGVISTDTSTAYTFTSIEQMLSVGKTNGQITNAGTYYKLANAWTIAETFIVLPTASLATKITYIDQFSCAVKAAQSSGMIDSGLGLTLRSRAAFIVAAGLHPMGYPPTQCLLVN